MRTGHRMALTATLATTAALSVAGVSWGVGTTVAGQASSSVSPPAVSDTTVGEANGTGQGNGRRGGGQANGSSGQS